MNVAEKYLSNTSNSLIVYLKILSEKPRLSQDYYA